MPVYTILTNVLVRRAGLDTGYSPSVGRIMRRLFRAIRAAPKSRPPGLPKTCIAIQRDLLRFRFSAAGTVSIHTAAS